MQESDPGIFRLTSHDPQTVDHLLPILFWLLTIGNKEGEDADVRRSHDIGGAQRAPETLQMRPEGFRHRHFAYRGAYGGYPDAALRGRGLYPTQLILRQVEHVGVPHAAQFHVAHGLLRECLQLFLQLGRDLICETRQGPHLY